MSSTNTSSSKAPQNSLKLDEETRVQQRQQPKLSALDEDDEFEEFPTQDWEDTETDLAHLGGATPGAAKSGGKLWEDNWDDDDVEDDFSKQLRLELQKTGQGTTGVGGTSVGNLGDAMQI